MNATPDIAELQHLVQTTIHRWRAGERPDADALLKRHPALAQDKRLAVDLIYEEYCLRHEQGDSPAPSTFCDRFPHYQQSLSRMLEVHETLQGSTATPALTPMSPWPKIGEAFMGYQLVEVLGRGSLARVFLAREAAVGNRLVVVKISRHGASEAQMLGKAAHPGIVPILSVKHDDNTGWTVICMPLLGTATGADLLQAAFAGKQAPPTASIIAQVARQYCPVGVSLDDIAPPMPAVWRGSYGDGIARFSLLLAEGLQAAHDGGIMHRDIKPSNILLAWSGRPMLLDFNLSTDIDRFSQRVGGTLAYMAPELMESLATKQRGPARQFDPRADIFSLGALLYELLTGRLPAKPVGAEELAPDDVAPWLDARRQDVVPLRQIDGRIDASLEAIVLRCLENDPANRLSTADELVGELQRHLGFVPRGWRLLRRERRKFLLAGLGTGVFAVAGAIYVSRLPPLEDRLFARGVREYDSGQYAAATKTFGKCLDIKPDWPAAHFARGQAWRQSGDAGAARTEFLALQDYDVALAHSLAGYCDLVLGNHVAAQSDYALAVQHHADDPTTWTNLGYCQARQGQFRKAIDSLDRALKADPENAIALCNRAVAMLQQSLSDGQPINDLAATDIEKACLLEPTRADFQFHAAAVLATALEADPSRKDADQLRRDAIHHLQQALELGYPPKSLQGAAPALQPFIGELQLQLEAPESSPPARPPAPLFAAPAETADLGDFLSL